MKKILVLALAIVMALSVIAFVACDQGETVTGEIHYTNHSKEYGAKVDVTVKGGVITAVKLYTDEESGYIRTSPDNKDYGWKGHDKTEAAYADFIEDHFVGKTVETVNAYKATIDKTSGKAEVTGNTVITGSTQSAARVILAVQDALSKLGK